MSEEIVVDAKNFAAVFRARELKRVGAVRSALVEAAHEGVAITTDSINKNVGRDTGGLVGSVHVENQGDTVEVVVDAPHAGIIELGARPHWAPIKPLLEWVMRHRASFGVSTATKVNLRQLSPALEASLRGAARAARDRAKARHAAYESAAAEAEKIAWAIRWKIHEEGSKPHHFMLKALPEMRDALGRVLQRKRTGTP